MIHQSNKIYKATETQYLQAQVRVILIDPAFRSLLVSASRPESTQELEFDLLGNALLLRTYELDSLGYVYPTACTCHTGLP